MVGGAGGQAHARKQVRKSTQRFSDASTGRWVLDSRTCIFAWKRRFQRAFPVRQNSAERENTRTLFTGCGHSSLARVPQGRYLQHLPRWQRAQAIGLVVPDEFFL